MILTRRRLAALLGPAALLGLVAALPWLPPDARAAEAPVVVELYTSQGCSSCPPADRFLGELSKRADVIALAWHIDYWDYIGWADPFADPRFTERQRAYAAFLGKRMVYTPQMIVAGRWDAVGSHRAKVEALLQDARAAGSSVSVSYLEGTPGRILLEGEVPAGGATVWAVFYQPEADTPVEQGENAGKTLTGYNIVRDLVPLGSFAGGRQELALAPLPAGPEACAILVQHDTTGAILGAAKIP